MHINPISPHIAILGCRGIPAKFGGFETFAEQLSIRLVKKGIQVTVFCEKGQTYTRSTFNGVKLKYIKTPMIIGLRSIWFDFASIIKSVCKYDLILMLGYHSAFSYFIPKLLRKHFWINMDGLEWNRDKWSHIATMYLKIMEFLAKKWSSKLVADSDQITDYLLKKGVHANKIITIPYGADLVTHHPTKKYINSLGLEGNDYYLVVCRLEPENHILEIIEGFLKCTSKRRLIIVGDSEARTAYVRKLKKYEGNMVRFVGTVYDKKNLESLRFYCFAYLHGHSVGGTNPSLLEAMASGNFVIAHDNPFNREVTNNKAWYFNDADTFTDRIHTLETKGYPEKVKYYFNYLIEKKYNWDVIAESYYKEIVKTLN
jgi:glycosyltransferase involved in cell wall biosynthesis